MKFFSRSHICLAMSFVTFDGDLSPASNDVLPMNPQAPQMSTRTCTNPTGLPAGMYNITQDSTEPTDPTCAVQVATNTAGTQWSRRSTGFPNVWSAWNMLGGGGGGGVTSFNGRVGVVVPLAGDYTATMITATPTGPNWPVGDTNVQSTLADLWAAAIPPAAVSEIVGTTLSNVGGWLPSGCVWMPANSRATPNAFASWALLNNGVMFNGPAPTGINFFHVSATAVITGPVTGKLGLRILNALGNVLCAGVFPDDGTGGDQTITISGITLDAVPAGFTLQALNGTATVLAAVQRFELDVVDLGPLQ
jgi:hypothetical protein